MIPHRRQDNMLRSVHDQFLRFPSDRPLSAGDARAFDLLYLRHRDRIHNVILSIVSHPEDALDLTQEVFLKAYQRLDTFKHAAQFYSWLYRSTEWITRAIESLIAINRCIDHKRRQSKHHVLINEPFSDEAFHCEPVNPLAALERDEFHRQLHAALPALTPAQHAVFILRYKEHLPLKAIAHRLGRSTGTVKAHLFQVHRTLRHQLLPYFNFAL